MPEPVESVLYQPFVNGDMRVNNVPYTLLLQQGPNAVRTMTEPYLSHKVLFQLSHIFKHMRMNNLKEVDYREFVEQEKALSAFNSEPNVEGFSVKEPNKPSPRTEKEVIAYVLEEWIGQYQTVKMQIRTDHNGNPVDANSRKAKEWIDLFHETLDRLPDLHKDIIRKKYLEVERDGKYSIDVFVYDELHITKHVYYKRKAEALYRLGSALSGFDSWLSRMN